MPAGNTSVKVTPVALSGPAFLTWKVYVTPAPSAGDPVLADPDI
jgi:hypothetical protein